MANFNHYELLLPKKLNINEYPVESYGLNYIEKLKENENYLNLSDKKTNNNINNNKGDSDKINEDSDLNNSLEEIYKEELSNFVSNENSIYPALICCKHGNTRLEDIRNYLLSCKKYKTSQTKIWPKYITYLLLKIKIMKVKIFI